MAAEDKIDKVAGKVKEGAGKATGDEDLEREGKAQSKIADAKDTVKDAAGKVKDAVQEAVRPNRDEPR